MMHECPRCKFAQPKDQYCANCGLDIANYTPAPDPAWRRLSKNVAVQIGTVALLVVGGGYFIYQSQNTRMENHFENAPEQLETFLATPSGSPTSSRRRGSSHQDDPSGTRSATNTAAMSDTDSDNIDGSGLEETTESSTSLDQDVGEMATSMPKEKSLSVTFFEASNPLLQQLASEGQILNETAQRRSFTSAGLITLEKLKERDPELKRLPGAQSAPLRPSLPLQMDFSHISPAAQEDVGLNLEFTVTQMNENQVELQVLGFLSLRDDKGEPIAQQNITANFVFSPENSLLMVGFLPRQTIRTEDAHGFSNTPLAIYDSATFLNGLTDFAILVQIK